MDLNKMATKWRGDTVLLSGQEVGIAVCFAEYVLSLMRCERCKFEPGLLRYEWCSCKGIIGCIHFEERE